MRSKEYIADLLDNGRHFCILPWMHLYVTGLGNMAACCGEVEGPYSGEYGSLNKNSFADLWQGEPIREFRLKLLNDEADPRCAICYEQAKSGLWNMRQWYNQSYGKQCLDWVAGTDSTGYAPDAKPILWDIRFSNLCNLKCRSCTYGSSSGWFAETKEFGWLDPKNSGEVVKSLQNSGRLLNDLEKYLPYLDKIIFAGGEPLLIDENYRILKKLDDLKKYDVELLYITNMTKLHSSNFDLLSVWGKFPKLCIAVSLDGISAKCEYLRKGLIWSEVTKNLMEVKQYCPNARIQVNFTASAFNIIHLAEFHRELIEKKYITADQIRISCLNEPKYYSIKILPPELKEQAANKINAHIEWLKHQPPFFNSENGEFFKQWLKCVEFMNSEDWTDLIPEFIEYTNKLDALRHEKCLEIFPELLPIFE